ncbi:MAG: choice-of-anchor Q domain-containing protein [Methylocella sp.]
MKLKSGSSAGAIYYDAYGTGPKPVLLGSVSEAKTSDWTALGGNLWQSVATFPPQPGLTNGHPYNNANDVGNIICCSPRKTGVEKWSQSDLKSPLDWFFRTSDWRVVVYSTTNPATAFTGLELAIDRVIVSISGASYAYLQNFDLHYGTASAIQGNGTTQSYLTFRDLDISYIGGGNLGGSGIRYGVGINLWGNAHNIMVERNRIWQIYDCGLANTSRGTDIVVHHITYRNNVLWNMSSLFNIWLEPTDNGGSTMHDIYVLNNTAIDPGQWGYNQHPINGNGGFGLVIGSPATVAVSNIVIKNNAFGYFPNNAIDEAQSFSMWKGVMYMDYNDWFKSATAVPVVHQWVPTFLDEPLRTWAASFPAEQHGIEADPRFVSLAGGDLHPGTGSPLINAGVNLTSLGIVLDFDRHSRPATGAFDIGAYQHLPAP